FSVRWSRTHPRTCRMRSGSSNPFMEAAVPASGWQISIQGGTSTPASLQGLRSSSSEISVNGHFLRSGRTIRTPSCPGSGTKKHPSAGDAVRAPILNCVAGDAGCGLMLPQGIFLMKIPSVLSTRRIAESPGTLSFRDPDLSVRVSLHLPHNYSENCLGTTLSGLVYSALKMLKNEP